MKKLWLALWILMGLLVTAIMLYLAYFPMEAHRMMGDLLGGYSQVRAQHYADDQSARNVIAWVGWTMLFCTVSTAYWSWKRGQNPWK